MVFGDDSNHDGCICHIHIDNVCRILNIRQVNSIWSFTLLITDQLTSLIREAVNAACNAGDLNLDANGYDVNLELPKNKQFGDFASNLALTLAKRADLKPREAAERI